MKIEAIITGDEFSDVKSSVIDMQMALEPLGWRFCGLRASPKEKQCVVIFRREYAA
jgi:hypothetical protein